MTKDEIKSKLREMLSEIVEMDVNEIKDDDNFFDNLSFTSITVVQLFVSCQDEFGISMQENVNLKDNITLNYIADLIAEKLEEKEKGEV
ncbi:MAG TPA: hypothetical protein DCQ78_06330 [Ruminococcus sp.]|nr:hypothetical protein [Ruminococcus sp.]